MLASQRPEAIEETNDMMGEGLMRYLLEEEQQLSPLNGMEA
jgi:hypothetical protein